MLNDKGVLSLLGKFSELCSFTAPRETMQNKTSNFEKEREGFGVFILFYLSVFLFVSWFSLVLLHFQFLFFAVKVNCSVKVLEVAF